MKEMYELNRMDLTDLLLYAKEKNIHLFDSDVDNIRQTIFDTEHHSKKESLGTEYLILWFDVDGEMVATSCSWSDLEKGTVKLSLFDGGRRRYYSIGYHPIKYCSYVSRFRFLDKESNSLLMQWEDREKLFEKYPKLKELIA